MPAHPSDPATRPLPDLDQLPVGLLADHLGQVARVLQAEEHTDAMLDELVAAAVRLVPGAQDASLSLVTRRRQVVSQHQTSDLAVQLDALQTEIGDGPCLNAIFEQRTVHVPDLGHEQRWPAFAQRAYDLGARSMLAFQLYVERDNLGALNLLSRQVDAFDDESEQIGLLFASHAAIAFAGARKLDHLAQAVDSRDLIGQAKGILMERYSIKQDRAFSVLLRVSQATHRKLRDVAEELLSTGRLAQLDES